MKKYLFTAVLALGLIAVSCNKDPQGQTVKALEVEFELTSTLGDLVYAEPVELEGNVTTTESVEVITLVAAKKEGESYVAVGEEQTNAAIESGVLHAEFFADSKEMTDIIVKFSAGDKAREFYLPVGSVSGELKGHVYMNDAAAFVADPKVPTHENTPELYPEENTGAGSDAKSFFSMHGIQVNGKLEHIVSLNDLMAVNGAYGSFCFLNALQNTQNNAYFGGQRGYMFSSLKTAQIGGGTTGRQDVRYMIGPSNLDANPDVNFSMKCINGSWAGEKYNADVYGFVDKLFISIKEANTPLKEMIAFWQLGEIQRVLDNSKLGVEENPTSLGGAAYLRKWVDAGHAAKVTATENFRAGDYIIIRSELTNGDEKNYYYGIMQIVLVPDDSAAWTGTNAGGYPCIDKDAADALFGKSIYLDIKSQYKL